MASTTKYIGQLTGAGKEMYEGGGGHLSELWETCFNMHISCLICQNLKF